MANKRMFSHDVVSTDNFLEMSLSAQALYFHLGMNADDDGFVSSPKRIQRSICATDEDLAELEDNGFVYKFDNGVYVMRHWLVNNNRIKPDRYKPTRYKAELNKLSMVDSVYIIKGVEDTEWNQNGDIEDTEWNQDGDIEDTQNRVDKSRTEESRTEESRTEENRINKDRLEESRGEQNPPGKDRGYGGKENPETPFDKIGYGKHGTVLLTRTEVTRLIDEYGKENTDNAIQELDNAIKGGYKVSDCYNTLVNILDVMRERQAL